MSITVRIPSSLQLLTEGRKAVEVDGATVADIITGLERDYPGIEARLLDETNQLRRFVNIYLNEEDIRFLDGLATAVPENAEVSIIPAVAGG